MFTTSTMRVRANFLENRLLQILLAVYVIAWILLAVGPFDRFDWMLENVLTVLFVTLLLSTYRIFPLSDLSYVLIFVFMVLHAIGAHYTYAEVPLGYWLKDALHLSRNHFDRIVHFSFGLLLAYPIREVFLRVASARGFWAYYLPLDVTLAFSAVYEIIEMAAAQATNPELGAAYLGTQGDIWDAQKDMGSAAIGAVLSMVITATVRRLVHKRPGLLAQEAVTSV
jgi:putative membrane protein